MIEEWIGLLIFNIVCSVIGTISNIIILLYYPFKCRKSTMVNYFVKQLAISDLIFCSFVIPFMISIKLVGTKFLLLCKIYSLSLNFNISYSFILSLLFGFERWISANKPHLLSKKILMFLSMFAVIIFFSASTPQIINYSSLKMENNSNLFLCIRRKNKNQSNDRVFILTIFQLIFFGILSILYLSVIRTIFKRMQSTNVENNKKLNQLRPALMLFGTTIVLFLSWFPIYIKVLAGKKPNSILQRLYMINNVTNCFVYLLFHKKFLKNVQNSFTKYFSNKTKVSSISVVSTSVKR